VATLGDALRGESQQALKKARRAAPRENPEAPRSSTIKVYLAADYRLKDELYILALILQTAGLEVTSRWIHAKNEPITGLSQERRRECAAMDLEDISGADVFVVVNPAEFADNGTGGRHVELGYALGIGKPVVVFGERTNVFHSIPQVRHSEEDFPLEQAVKEAYHLRKQGRT
jgi:nucleoside 2-deoxyribosyltransferase